jgi:hypothetical protein
MNHERAHVRTISAEKCQEVRDVLWADAILWDNLNVPEMLQN